MRNTTDFARIDNVKLILYFVLIVQMEDDESMLLN
jgi:hypothetical protein